MPPRDARALGSQRYYQWRNEKFWSVTTIIGGGCPKPALQRWNAKVVAEGAVQAHQLGSLGPMIEQDPDSAAEFLKQLPYKKKDRAADLGTRVHEAVEAYATGKTMPEWADDERARMEHFMRFLDDYRPEWHAAEASCYSRKHGFAGTFDGVADIGGRRVMLDMKTGKGIYPEVALQLAAYRNAEFIGLADGSEVPMPETEAAVALHLTDDGYELIDVDTGDEVFRAFLYVREVHRWMEETSKRVLLGPTVKPDRAPVSPEEVAAELSEEEVAE